MSTAQILPGYYTALGYRAAEVERKSGRALPSGGSADRHLRNDRELLGRIAERLDRDNGIYEGLLNRAVEAIIGPGFTLSPNTGDSALNDAIAADWASFGESPEVRGVFDWQDCERLALRGVFNAGDLGVILTKRQRYQYIEAERITGGRRAVQESRQGGTIDQGVELDALGAPLAYWVAPRDRWGMVRAREARRVRADDFVFTAHRKRFSQTRGTPVLSTAFAQVHRINDVCDAEAIAWQLLARYALIVNRQGGPQLGHDESAQDSDGHDPGPGSASQGADLADRVVDLHDDAIIFNGEKGEDLRAIQRDLPGANFPESVRMYLRLVGLPIGLPLEVILLDYSKSPYTAARAALEQAWRSFVSWQRFLKRRHHTPLYLRWLEWRIAEGVYPDRPETRRHGWDSPEFPWIDQLKEAKAWGERMDRGLATQTQALKSIAMDRGTYADQREAEVVDAIERAERLNKQFPEANVDWRMFCGVPVSKTQGRDEPERDQDAETEQRQ